MLDDDLCPELSEGEIPGTKFMVTIGKRTVSFTGSLPFRLDLDSDELAHLEKSIQSLVCLAVRPYYLIDKQKNTNIEE
jgi:hypothetical protein